MALDPEAQTLMQSIARTHDNLATHVVALTALIGALLEANKKPKADRVKYWSEATARGQKGMNATQVEAIAMGILKGPQKASTAKA